MHNIAEGTKIDIANYPQTGVTSSTGLYFPMTKYAKALFSAQIAGQTTGQSLTFAVYESTDHIGTSTSQLGATITMAQGIKVSLASVLAASVQVGDTLILTPYTFVDGVLSAGTAITYTAAAAENLSAREFNQASTDAACATSLAACINDATYGVPGLYATVSSATVTIEMDVQGEGAFDITELAAAAARLVVTDLAQQATFEVAVQDLDRDNDYCYVQARLASIDAGTEHCVTLLRAMPSYAPVGLVSAYYDDAK